MEKRSLQHLRMFSSILKPTERVIDVSMTDRPLQVTRGITKMQKAENGSLKPHSEENVFFFFTSSCVAFLMVCGGKI